jgi:NAD(P)H-hydrate epimerase
MELITIETVRKILKPRQKNAYKNNFGNVLIIAGSEGMMGAAVLAAKACLKSGVGLLTVHVPNKYYLLFPSVLPEAMYNLDTSSNFITDQLKDNKYNAIGMGPGIGMNINTCEAIKYFLENKSKPTVIDADALNIISTNEHLKILLKGTLLTPHVGECKRLVGIWHDDDEKNQKILDFVKKYECVLMLKGMNSTIYSPKGNIYLNTTGNPGMAKAGSGDALTGILTALIGQGYSLEESAIAGVFIHGLAGDFAVENNSNYSMLASDLINYLPIAFKDVLGE